jgi:hypothetical protein
MCAKTIEVGLDCWIVMDCFHFGVSRIKRAKNNMLSSFWGIMVGWCGSMGLIK